MSGVEAFKGGISNGIGPVFTSPVHLDDRPIGQVDECG
jgi:hypothetical protein